ncbi:MAG: glycosyl hydrolase 115 family protein [Prevotella sp.]|nr:glycosyl hydrolase 115 family protein [Prevotella sp.]
MYKQIIVGLTMLLTASSLLAQKSGKLVWYDGKKAVTYEVKTDVAPVVKVALDMFSDDMAAVTGRKAIPAKKGILRIIELDKADNITKNELARKNIPFRKILSSCDGFHISVIENNVYIVGKNGRGTAYGILEMSRMAGVNPWIWWGDIEPEHMTQLTIDSNTSITQSASVEYRGIFINDEDWSIRPWSENEENGKTVEKGLINRNIYKKVFQLMMRLRANAIWPAMHEGTVSFFKTPGAKDVADSCGIAVGTSHCEPLLRSNTGEWNVKERGAFNYFTNRENVQRYWTERLDEVKNSAGGNLFTIGMRGIHDGSMEGAKTMEQKFHGLQRVINDQQELIAKHIGDPTKQTQIFIPYKEVLQIYERGLKVPEYVTLMWCDDNYGYITRLSNEEEQRRSGGAGIYYHLSYWGRPHDYLWLTTTQPGLIYNQMRTAYDHNARKLWIANVHDPKVAGYDLELFLDMAWDINSVDESTIEEHYGRWLCRQFGNEAGKRLFPAMWEFYRLCGQRRPEFMGWTQVELDKKKYHRGLSPVQNTEFSLQELGDYLQRYASIVNVVKKVEDIIPARLKDAYFAAIEYPVLAADANARKLLLAQKARQTGDADAAQQSKMAYDDIKSLTMRYNNDISNGKWQNLMSMNPRNLPVFGMPDTAYKNDSSIINQSENISHDTSEYISRNANEYTSASAGCKSIQMLGHSMNAVSIPKGGTLDYTFDTSSDGDAVMRIALIPTQPNDNGDIRFSASIDGGEEHVFSLKEPFRSERWKQNVLRGQALREIALNGLISGRHTLRIKALDNHVIVDQWNVDFDKKRKYYLLH